MSLHLEQYLHRTISCACGRQHRTSVRVIDLAPGALGRLPDHIRALGYQNVYLTADANTWEAAGQAAAAELERAGIACRTCILPDRELVPDERAVAALEAELPAQTDLVLAVGAGTINDLCKFISLRAGVDYMIFASAPSMDGFVSVGAALIQNHMKVTVDAQGPVAIIGDPAILAAAPMCMITAGLADTLGKYTSLLDWKLSSLINGEYYCEAVASMVEQALETILSQRDRIAERDPAVIQTITEALVLTGIAMSFVGNSRPASGCEHHLSHYWEMQFQMAGRKPILHGTKVGVGLITMLDLAERLLAENPDFRGAMERPFDEVRWESRVRACFLEAAEGILELERTSGKNDPARRNLRLERLEALWPEICRTIRESLPSAASMRALLRSLDAPTEPAEIGISGQMTRDAIVLAKEVRNRYSLLQLMWDLDLLEQFASERKGDAR